MPITINVTISDATIEQAIRDTFANYPEANSSNALQCQRWRYRDNEPLSKWKLDFVDTEDGKKYSIGEAEMRKAFELAYTDKWPAGLIKPPISDKKEDWDDWLSMADNTYHDALAQLACLGEVIYG